jgi:hypothetical protein
MHSAIFVAEMPEQRGDWGDFLGIVNVKLKDAKVERISENVWQVNFQESPAALAWLVALCEQRGIPYKILPLADAPQWLPVSIGPRPK